MNCGAVYAHKGSLAKCCTLCRAPRIRLCQQPFVSPADQFSRCPGLSSQHGTARAATQSTMLFYIHVPFCRSRCAYCSFYSLATGHRTLPEGYVPGLLRDIAWLGQRFGKGSTATPDAGPVTSIFLGGGTPSLLAPQDVERILGAVSRAFCVTEDCEVTMEANPESLQDKKRVQGFRNAGITRLSMGVQTMTDEGLKALGRVHTVSQALQAADNVHAAGFASFGLDLMWGLPGQRCEDWCQVLEKACALAPDHISAYGLTVEEGTRLASAVDEGRIVLPEEEELARMFLEGHALLTAHGFEHYEISNFARQGHCCRHNLGYWQGVDYLGAGPGAVSTWQHVRIFEPCDLNLWLGTAPDERTREREELGEHTVREERIMLSLRTSRGLDVTAWEAETGENFLDRHASCIQALLRADLARIDREDGRTWLALTPEGMLASNDIVARFF